MASLSIGEHTFVSKVKFPDQKKVRRESVKTKREEEGSGRRAKKRWTEGGKEEE